MMNAPFLVIITGLDPAIHRVFRRMMDARVKPSNDDRGAVVFRLSQASTPMMSLSFMIKLLAVELDLGAGPFAEQHAVADLDVDRDQLAGLVAAARAHCRDFALRGLFLGGVGNDDAAFGLLFGVDTLDHDAVMQR